MERVKNELNNFFTPLCNYYYIIIFIFVFIENYIKTTVVIILNRCKKRDCLNKTI